MAEHEADYKRVVESAEAGQFLPGTSIEVMHADARKAKPKYAVFDFDGTLSLVREGWPEIMVPMMVEYLQKTDTQESDEELYKVAMDFVMDLTGKQTIYQMIRLAEEITKRGGTPEDPQVYKQDYHDRLMQRITDRREALRSGQADPKTMLVPGSYELLEALQAEGIKLYLASGTDEPYVKEEVALLGLDPYFGEHVYGAQDDYKSFSKAQVIQRILTVNEVPGDQLIGFGDGFVEIQNVKEAGGLAVGVATDEENRDGKPDKWKRDRLIGVGADLIIPDFGEVEPLMKWICGE
jgi:phosphoglycolate phosphatase